MHKATEEGLMVRKVEAEYLVYVGAFFQIEFYFDREGNIPIWTDFVALSEKDQVAFMVRVEKLANSRPGIIHPKAIFNLENDIDKIWAIKFGNNRFCSFFYEGGKIIITNAYKKQSQQNRNKEVNQINKASKMKRIYEIRIKEKSYYPKKDVSHEK